MQNDTLEKGWCCQIIFWMGANLPSGCRTKRLVEWNPMEKYKLRPYSQCNAIRYSWSSSKYIKEPDLLIHSCQRHIQTRYAGLVPLPWVTWSVYFFSTPTDANPCTRALISSVNYQQLPSRTNDSMFKFCITSYVDEFCKLIWSADFLFYRSLCWNLFGITQIKFA